MNYNIFNIIILVGIIHGIIFGTILLKNKHLKSKTNNYLSLTVFSLALSNLQYWLKDVGLYPNIDALPFFPFEFLMLPFFYFFVKSYLEMEIKKNEKIFLISFFPFFVIYQYIFIEKYFSIKLIELLNLFIEYISMIYSIFLIFVIFSKIIHYEKRYTDNISISTKWLKHTLIIGLVLCALWFTSLTLFDSIFHRGYYQFYPLWIGLSVLIYWIGYTSILQSNILKQRKVIRGSNKSLISKNTSKEFNKTFSAIENKILSEKLHLNPNLKLKLIAIELNLSEGYLSQLFKRYSDNSFNDYINKLRVNEAKRMLCNKDYKNYTITAIGLESGFNSKSNFYSVFKKITSKTPNEYKKEVQNS